MRGGEKDKVAKEKGMEGKEKGEHERGGDGKKGWGGGGHGRRKPRQEVGDGQASEHKTNKFSTTALCCSTGAAATEAAVAAARAVVRAAANETKI